jgi:hypothetical protein
LQTIPEENLKQLSEALLKVRTKKPLRPYKNNNFSLKALPKKSDLGWDLEELEAAGRLTLEEEKSSLDILTKQLQSGLKIKTTDCDSDDTSDSDWETESTSSESSSELEESTSCSNEED